MRCLTAHNCEAIVAAVDHKLSDHTDHLDGVVIVSAEDAKQEWDFFNEGMTVEFPLCKRCMESMTIDDDGEKFCKGCRLSEAEEAGLTQTSISIQQRFKNLNKSRNVCGNQISQLLRMLLYLH